MLPPIFFHAEGFSPSWHASGRGICLFFWYPSFPEGAASIHDSLVQKLQSHPKMTEISTSCKKYQIPRSPRYFRKTYHILGHSICFLYRTSTPKPLQLCAQAYRNKQRTHFLSWADINIHQYLKHFSTIMLLNNFKLLDSAQIGTYRQVGSWKLLMCDFYWSHQQTKYAPTQLATYCLKEALNSVSDSVPQWVYLQVEFPSLSFILPDMAIYSCFTFKSLIIWKVL